MKFILKNIIYKISSFFNVHPDVIKLIRSGFKLTNPTSANFPSENLPLASRVIASGMWNYCFFQFYRNFVGPYWVERQYNPKDPSFIPRATSLLSLNLTHRNWFGFRGPLSDCFSIIDPSGAFSPVVGYYSIQLAFKKKDKIFIPNRRETKIKFHFINQFPIPFIEYEKFDLKVFLKLVGDTDTNQTVLGEITYETTSLDWELYFTIRPFNPEGGALINHLEYKEENSIGKIFINNQEEIRFLDLPEEVNFSNLEKGDAFFVKTYNKFIHCEHGIATGTLIFPLKPDSVNSVLFYTRTYEQLVPSQIDPFETDKKKPEKYKKKVKDIETNKKIKEYYILKGREPISDKYTKREEFLSEIQKSILKWKEITSRKAIFATNIEILDTSAQIHSNIVFELQTSNKITPGVYTYRQFWFRDAAYMLSALTSWNFLEESKKVISTYPYRQDKDGFFKSHEGEWDSTGQAIWSIVDFYKKSRDINLLKDTMDSLIKGASWIIKKRKKGYLKKLMPAGFSAEHLGPADYYYWDNLWSMAGLRDAAYACSQIPDYKKYEDFFLKELEEYKRDFLEITKFDREKFGVLPAAPNRGIDPGIIGSLVDLYPLQLNLLSDSEIKKTLKTIYKNYFINDLFFHPIIHSGFNIYLSLQVAHSFLKLNKPKISRKILKQVLKKRGHFWAYPEAIHPVTGGGVMGDGFHGWASSEIILLLRELVISEYKNNIFIFRGFKKKELLDRILKFGPFPTEIGIFIIDAFFSNKHGKLQIQIENLLIQNEKQLLLKLPYKNLNEKNIIIKPNIPFTINKDTLIPRTIIPQFIIEIL